MKLYNLKDHNEQVSFAQAVTQGLASIRGCSFRTICRNSA
jgi:threonine synthase